MVQRKLHGIGFRAKGLQLLLRVCLCVCLYVCMNMNRRASLPHTLSFSLASFVYFVFSYLLTPQSTKHWASKRADEPHYNFQPEFISQNYKRTEARKLFYSQINAHFKTIQLRYSPSNGPRKLIKIVRERECAYATILCVRVDGLWAASTNNFWWYVNVTSMAVVCMQHMCRNEWDCKQDMCWCLCVCCLHFKWNVCEDRSMGPIL